MTKDKRRKKATVLLLIVMLVLVSLGSFLVWSFLPEEVRQGETAPPAEPAAEKTEQEENSNVQSAGVVKLCYCVPREQVQGLISALEGLSLRVEPVPLAISFDRSKIYITNGAKRTEDVKNLLPHASVEGLTGENYDYIIYIGTDYQG